MQGLEGSRGLVFEHTVDGLFRTLRGADNHLETSPGVR